MVPPGENAFALRRVWLTQAEEAGYYYGIANEGLWPLCHLAHVRPTFRSDDWEQYRAVNTKFADALVEETEGCTCAGRVSASVESIRRAVHKLDSAIEEILRWTTVVNYFCRTATTDTQGEFRFLGVSPGHYTVRVELSGFSSYERRGNVVSASERLSIGRLKLQMGAMTEAVTVEAEGTRVNPEDSQPTGLLTSTQISQIQTKGRDVADLLRLLPGVRYGDDKDALGESFGTELPNIGGQRKHWNHVTVDGVMQGVGGPDETAVADSSAADGPRRSSTPIPRRTSDSRRSVCQIVSGD